jgi:hypothetical protein
MSISKFLREKIGIRSGDVDALERLAGRRIGGAVGFLPDLEAALGAIEPWMPIHFLPIGDVAGYVLGAWLRPKGVEAGRFVTARASEGEIVGTGTLEHLVYVKLLRLEASYPDPSSEFFKGPLEVALSAFGSAFYRPGSHGKLDDGVVERLDAAEKGGCAEAWGLLASPSVDQTRVSLRQAIRTDPDCLCFHAMAAREAAAKKNHAEASQEGAAALACYFESAWDENLDDFLDLVRQLAKKQPDAFQSDESRLALAMGDPSRHAALTREIGERGNLAAVEKTVCDTGWLAGDCSRSLDVLHALYRRMGWSWGVALCDLRK